MNTKLKHTLKWLTAQLILFVKCKSNWLYFFHYSDRNIKVLNIYSNPRDLNHIIGLMHLGFD